MFHVKHRKTTPFVDLTPFEDKKQIELVAIASKNVVSRETLGFLLTFVRKKQEETEQKAKENNEDGATTKNAAFEENINQRTVFALEQRAVQRYRNEKTKAAENPPLDLTLFFYKNLLQEVKKHKKR